MSKISVILATYNEERNIKDCLESVKDLADEIVIVDGSSIDRTVEIAKKYTKQIFIRENPLMFHINKQYAIEKATGDWILYLDTDERATPELKKEILDATCPSGGRVRYPLNAGYWIPRKNIIFGKWIKHTGWWPDYQLRLFRRGKGYLPCRTVHEQPVVKGKTGKLRESLVHYNYQTIFQFIDKLNRLYTENDKNLFLAEKKKIFWHEALSWPANEFFKRFFKEEGYKDGLHGLILSLLQAFSVLVTFAKIWEAQGFKEVKEEDFLLKTEREFQKAIKDLKYWFLTSKIDQVKNPINKIWLKIQRKLYQ